MKKRNKFQEIAADKVRQIRVDKREAGLRLDIFLTAALGGLSRKKAKNMIDSRKVSVNGRIESMASRTVKAGELVETAFMDEPDAIIPKTISILYEDEVCIAVNKPPGIPSGPTKDPSRIQMEKLASQLTGMKLTLIHRLDKDTSGVLLLAKNKNFAAEAAKAFKERKVEKIYLALVKGKTSPAFNSIIHLKEGEAGRMLIVKSGGMRADSSFKTLAQSAEYSLLEIIPKTGRTHQIRVQLAAIGHSILGDSLYGGIARINAKNETTAIPRHMLHAKSLTIFHPNLKKELLINSPIPEDFLVAAKTAFTGKIPSCLKK